MVFGHFFGRLLANWSIKIGVNLEYFSHPKLVPFYDFCQFYCNFAPIVVLQSTLYLCKNWKKRTHQLWPWLDYLTLSESYENAFYHWNTQDSAKRRPRKWPKTDKKYLSTIICPYFQKYMTYKEHFFPWKIFKSGLITNFNIF